MKKLTLSIAAVMAMGTFAIAGGDIAPVEEPMVEVVAPVVDDSGFYIGLGYSMVNVTKDYDFLSILGSSRGTYKEDNDAIMMQAGYKINQYIAVESRYWKSVGDADWSDRGDGYDFLGYHTYDLSGTKDYDFKAWGIYVKPMYPVTDALDVYALLGYGNVVMNYEFYDWLDENGFQWGLGVSYSFADNFSVFADYVKLYNDDGEIVIDFIAREDWDATIDTWNFGLTYKF